MQRGILAAVTKCDDGDVHGGAWDGMANDDFETEAEALMANMEDVHSGGIIKEWVGMRWQQ